MIYGKISVNLLVSNLCENPIAAISLYLEKKVHTNIQFYIARQCFKDQQRNLGTMLELRTVGKNDLFLFFF